MSVMCKYDIILFLLIFSFANSVWSENGLMPVSIVPDVYEIEIMEGQETQIVYQITNNSTQQVELVYIFAECDCSFDKMPSSLLLPALSTGEFPVLFHADKPGEYPERITFFTDHAKQREFSAGFKAIISKRDI